MATGISIVDRVADAAWNATGGTATAGWNQASKSWFGGSSGDGERSKSCVRGPDLSAFRVEAVAKPSIGIADGAEEAAFGFPLINAVVNGLSGSSASSIACLDLGAVLSRAITSVFGLCSCHGNSSDLRTRVVNKEHALQTGCYLFSEIEIEKSGLLIHRMHQCLPG